MFPVESSHLLDNPLMIWPIAAYYFFFTLIFTLNPGTGKLFSSGHSQERDKRPLKVVHSIEVLLQVNLLTILSTLVITGADPGGGCRGCAPPRGMTCGRFLINTVQ